MRGSKIVIILLVLAALLAQWGCKGKESAGEPNEMVLYHTLASRIKGLDPAIENDMGCYIVAGQILETLYQYHYLKRPYTIVPLLAKEMPWFSDDGLSCEITISEGVYFQDDGCFTGGKGRELKAEDFVFSIKRIADIKNRSQNWPLLAGRIVGLDEFRQYTRGCASRDEVDYGRAVEGLAALDEYRLLIKLRRPWPEIAFALADPATSAVAKEAVDYYGQDIISHPVGTGPFMLGRWYRGSFIELVRNRRFRGEAYPAEGQGSDVEAGYLDDAGKIMPFADRVIWTVIRESQPGWFLFMQGKIDAKSIPKDNWEQAIGRGGVLSEKLERLGIELKTFEQPTTFYLGFNMEDAVVGGNRILREAISCAIDREEFVRLFTNGRDMVACGLLPPVMGYENKEGGARFGPGRARELVKKAAEKYGGELAKLSIAMPGAGTFYRQYGQFVRRQLERAGLEVQVEYMDLPTFNEKVNGGGVQIFAGSCDADRRDALEMMKSFYSMNHRPGPNKFNYVSAEFDRLYEEAQVTTDLKRRQILYKKMEQVIQEDCPAVFLNHRVAFVLHHGWYKNYKPHAFGYGLSKYRRIDTAKRRAYGELSRGVR